jgi:diacylglycerol kinase (ATP)
MVDPRTEPTPFSNPGWQNKFRFAVRGLSRGIRGSKRSVKQNSFLVHLPCSVLVIVAAIWLQVGWVSMALLVICVGMVLVTELINTSIEELAKAVSNEHDENIGAALDIAAGAVLLASLTAAVVGGLIFIPRLIEMVSG